MLKDLIACKKKSWLYDWWSSPNLEGINFIEASVKTFLDHLKHSEPWYILYHLIIQWTVNLSWLEFPRQIFIFKYVTLPVTVTQPLVILGLFDN